VDSVNLSGRAILIVDDERILAFDIADAFEAAGAEIFVASTYSDAIRRVELGGLSAAVLDSSLGQDDAARLCGRLAERGVCVVLHSANPANDKLNMWGVVINKPCLPEMLISRIWDLLRVRDSMQDDERALSGFSAVDPEMLNEVQAAFDTAWGSIGGTIAEEDAATARTQLAKILLRLMRDDHLGSNQLAPAAIREMQANRD
jgi:DNA-binding response OmpR family regulator